MMQCSGPFSMEISFLIDFGHMQNEILLYLALNAFEYVRKCSVACCIFSIMCHTYTNANAFKLDVMFAIGITMELPCKL